VTKRIASKYKISRRLGVSLWGRAKDPVNRRAYGPGQHGATRRRKLSDYGLQLNEKQKFKGYYGSLSERQFRRIYSEAARRKGNTGEIFVGLLESRLDAFVYRMGVVKTIFAARQFVTHGHINVNGKRSNIPSQTLKAGDVVSVREKSREMTVVLEALQSPERNVPSYVQMDDSKLEAKYVAMPKLSDIPYAAVMEPNLVIEFYSR
jgi:small subunit ribosomal protein S4